MPCAARPYDSVVPFSVRHRIRETLKTNIGPETDDTRTRLPNTTFVAGAESRALGAVSIAVGQRAAETDAGANYIGTRFESLGMNAGSREKGNDHQGDAKKS